MQKSIVGILALSALISGCASQSPTEGPFSWLSATSVPPPTKRPPGKIARPAIQKSSKGRKYVAAKAPPSPEAPTQVITLKTKPALVTERKTGVNKAVALNKSKSDCETQRPNLPADADRRSATISVQCFFISRGEYLTTTGAVKPLR